SKCLGPRPAGRPGATSVRLGSNCEDDAVQLLFKADGPEACHERNRTRLVANVRYPSGGGATRGSGRDLAALFVEREPPQGCPRQIDGGTVPQLRCGGGDSPRAVPRWPPDG